MMRKYLLVPLLALQGSYGFAQDDLRLDESCLVTIGNQTVAANPDGTFVVPNVAIFQSRDTGIPPQLFRVRATCNNGGETITGQSELLFLVPGETTLIGDIFPTELHPIPISLTVTADAEFLPFGATSQLTVIAHFVDGSTADVTSPTEGTTYVSTSSNVLSVDQNGVVTSTNDFTTPLKGTIVVINEGNLGTVDITAVGQSNDFDNDGMPNDYEDLFGLNKFVNDANGDLDVDGLSNIDEFNVGSIPNNPDTDADGIPDGLDGDPLHPEESAPTIEILSPVSGETRVEGETILFAADVQDDGLLTEVVLSTSTGFSQTFTSPPFQVAFTIPLGVTQVDFTVTATDSVPNESAALASIQVIQDPRTTVVGHVMDLENNLLEGASVVTNGGLMDTTGPDGTFLIPGVQTILGDIVVHAQATVEGKLLTGRSSAVPPLLGGVTNVGGIIVSFNGGFETGDFTGYVVDGNAFVLSELEFVMPPEGQYMAFISTGPVGTIGHITLPDFRIPADVAELAFTFNFMSDELDEGPAFNDTFVMRIVPQAGNPVEIVRIAKNDLVNGLYEVFPAPTGFDGMTGFLDAVGDVSQFAGQEVLLDFCFLVTDVGDTVVDSAVLLDDIHVR